MFRGMPSWLSALLATVAERQAREEAAILEAEHHHLLLTEKVRDQLLAGKRRCGGEAAELMHEWAFDAAKDLVHNDRDVDELGAAALRAR